MLAPQGQHVVAWMWPVLILAYAAHPFKDRIASGPACAAVWRISLLSASLPTFHVISKTSQQTMKFDIEIPTCREGVFVPIGFAGPADIVKTVEAAERLGFDAVWATDFLTPTPEYRIPDAAPPNWYEPMVALAYCAARTRAMKLGP